MITFCEANGITLIERIIANLGVGINDPCDLSDWFIEAAEMNYVGVINR